MLAPITFDHAEYDVALTFDDPANLLDSMPLLPTMIDAAVAYLAQYVRFGGTIDIEVVVDDTPTGRFAGGPNDLYTVGETDSGLYLAGVSLISESQSGVDLDPSRPDLRIYVPTDTDYLALHWFDPDISTTFDANPPNDKSDIFSVLVHELLHGLGVSGYRNIDTGVIEGDFESVFDTFVEVADGRAWFTGPAVVDLLGEPLELRVGGSQGIYHLGAGPEPSDSSQLFLLSDNLNSYYYYQGERYAIGLLDLAILSDLGWTIKANTLTSVTNTWDDFDNAYFLVGGNEANSFTGSPYADKLEGRGGNDVLTGLGGNDILYGGDGDDVAVYSGDRADYEIVIDGDAVRVTDRRVAGSDGSDRVYGIETLQFADGTFDTGTLLGNHAPAASDDTAFAIMGSPVLIDVLANDSDPDQGDSLTVVVLQASRHGTVMAGSDNALIYTANAGYTGGDSFSYAAIDRFGQASAALVTVEVAMLDSDSDFRLFASDGYEGQIGGTGTVFGTGGFQSIGIADLPGTVTFDPSFNRGGDLVRLTGEASEWQVVRSGSTAILGDGATFVVIPVGTVGIRIGFDDGQRTLLFDASIQSMRIGDQAFGGTLAKVTSPAQEFDTPLGTAPDATARLFMAAGAEVTVAGNLDVFGTRSGHEHLALPWGEARLDPSFNSGGDTLTFVQPYGTFEVSVSGSSAVFDGLVAHARVPIGTTGTTIDFADEARLLVYQQASGSVLLGEDVIYPLPSNLT